MHLKKWIVFIVILILSVNVVFAEDILIAFQDQSVVDERLVWQDGETVYGGLVAFAEMYGAQVTWSDVAQAAYLKHMGRNYVFEIGSSAVVTDTGLVKMETETVTLEGRLFVPMSYLAAVYDFDYVYDEALKIATLDGETLVLMPEQLDEMPVSLRYVYTDEELLMLARLVDLEARDGSILKKTAVANVVLNRVEHTGFPNTVEGVIFQKGQFPPAYYSSFNTLEPKPESFEAALRAFEGEVVIEEALYFNYIPFSWKSDSDFIKNIEGDYFYR